MRCLASLLVVIVLAAGCTSGGPEPSNPEPDAVPALDVVTREVEVVGATLTYPSSEATGVASRIDELPLDQNEAFGLLERFDQAIERDTPLAFALRSCTDEGAGRLVHEIQWRGPPDVELPVTVTLWVGPQDGPSNGQGGLFEVVLETAGVFPLRLDQTRTQGDDEDGRITVRAEEPREQYCEMLVLSEEYIDEQTETGLTYEPSATAPLVTAPSGSLQSFAIDGLAAGPLIRELLIEAGPTSDLLPDRWWLSVDAEPESISIRRDSTCWLIVSLWKTPAVEVQQERGCEPDSWPSTFDVIRIEDPAWNVVVAGEPGEVRDYLSSIASVPVAGVEPVIVGGAEFDALATFEAELEEEGYVEFGRIPWGENGVIVVWNGNGELEGEIEAAGFNPEWFNVGGSGTPIQDGICAATLEQGSPTAGFAVVIYEDPEIERVEVQRSSGDWESVEIIENGQFRLGLLDGNLQQEGAFGVNAPPIRGFDEAGVQIDCVRSN